MDNPKIKAFKSCFFVHEAIHVFFQVWKTDDFKSSINFRAFLWLLHLGQEDEYKRFLGIWII